MKLAKQRHIYIRFLNCSSVHLICIALIHNNNQLWAFRKKLNKVNASTSKKNKKKQTTIQFIQFSSHDKRRIFSVCVLVKHDLFYSTSGSIPVWLESPDAFLFCPFHRGSSDSMFLWKWESNAFSFMSSSNGRGHNFHMLLLLLLCSSSPFKFVVYFLKVG